jgi:DDE superfamily endonuclease
VRLMFQDEGRFGRLSRPARCWAPRGIRPIVKNRLVREYTYAFAAISPQDGVMDSLILPWVNAETMSLFLRIVANRHSDEFILMVLDGAGWHTAGDLVVPQNMRLLFLPPYSPELNPVEHLWDHLREKHFANRLFPSMRVVTDQLSMSLRKAELDAPMIQSLCGFGYHHINH